MMHLTAIRIDAFLLDIGVGLGLHCHLDGQMIIQERQMSVFCHDEKSLAQSGSK